VAALDERGAELGVEVFPTTPAGYRRALRWLRHLGELDRVGVEGTGSYGAGLTSHLQSEGIEVVEINCPDRQRRRSHGKSDPVDALAAARAVLGGEAKTESKTRVGNVEAIRALRIADRSARHNRNMAINQMRALLLTGPEHLREQFRGTTVWRMVRGAARLRPGDPTSPAGATKYALRLLGRRVLELEAELADLKAILKPLVAATAPGLVGRHGVGTDTAGALLVAAGDNPERLRDERSFAHYCGASPIDASSGLVVRKRLNRGGNRSANEALWRIDMVRLVSDPRTRHYMERRTKEGKSKRETIRCLKRYVAREVYPFLSGSTP
jgi:transposase